MDWLGVGKQLVSKGLPLLGTALGGPAGGAVGGLVASVLGCSSNDPDEIAAAISADPQALVKLRELEMAHRENLEKIALDRARLDSESAVAQISEVNATMRAEATSEHWPQWSWRPFWGFVSGLAFLAVAILVCVLAYKAVLGGRPEAMAMIPQLVGAFTALFGVPATILGIASWHRGKQKRETAAITAR